MADGVAVCEAVCGCVWGGVCWWQGVENCMWHGAVVAVAVNEAECVCVGNCACGGVSVGLYCVGVDKCGEL